MKRLIAFALTFIFALALAGCNNIAANEPKMYTSSMTFSKRYTSRGK